MSMPARKEHTMKKINISRTLLSVTLLGTFAVAPLVTPTAQADPPRQAPAYGRRAKDDKGKYKKDKKDKGRNDDRRDDDRDDDDRRDDDRYDRDRYDRDRDYRNDYDRDPRNNNNNASFTGTVVNVRGGNSFDLNANGRTYNVYVSGALPRGLSEGDTVRVYGRLYGANDIRNANVRITNNTRDRDGRDDYNNDGGRYQTFNGTVVNLRNDREFDIRDGGRTYNVVASSSTRNLSNGDTVRIYGQRIGDNDIRNANVTITRNNGNSDRYDDRNNDRNGDDGNYQTFRGIVRDVRNDREFNVIIGLKTYNVTASSSTNGLSRGDEVRVYGQRFGDNDIRNANVTITRNR